MAEKILVISTFPPKGTLYNHSSSAVAGYTKNTLVWANEPDKNFSFTVLADILDSEEEYEDNDIKVKRIWKRNSFSLFSSIYNEIVQNKDIRKIFFAFEWAMFGSKKYLMGFLPILLLLLRLQGKKIYFVSHGVLLNAGLVSIQMGVRENSLKAKIWSLGLKILYFFIILLSDKVVVFEEYLRQELLKLIPNSSKILTINHGVETKTDSSLSKKKTDEFAVQSFGFLIWYKGSDWLVEEMANYFKNNPNSKIRLTMVGGATKTYTDLNYKNYIDKIYDTAEKSDGKVQITGFIKEKEIADYFQKADLFILPYRVLVSASGPLSLAFTYRKPFLISENLKGYCLSNDFSQSLTQTGLSIKDLVFSMSGNGLPNKIENLIKDNNMLEKIQRFSELMYEKRKWPVIGKKYADVLSK
ncbi:hypothetical protein COS55_01235 [Candidatus Shapirobacteria bacterium CG03_land_8_20_14_0_80_40_19]|uniref:Glycosyl transferase family 1 domain-containing protein n=3 Tax=Candidatus Shapironibacteriota TaxID=1752721 RepID=A0A2M7BER2_9BACT|nr:MAG: hypothetical protein COV89_00580 [Candidatus Shapirobacteria bacterium CG11_big_fil_rev_8_21_14_0_20_40_12]PIV01632.1 MAG: hypothetical protein COS55_01235 [Candidatus Shapirobacteria bacterium CG03_land_8_20_14_0_80_40_19]PJC29045.1 MAG: hypothetical protein CO053_01440 [Candidatus Shapirobacteria bacterium CG_4_9_14_0_2_um_filter_40_11]